jgi:hypothetical protein
VAFPTTAVLENFTGSDGANLDSDWTALSGATLPKIQSNQCANQGAATYIGAWYDLSTFGADSEAYLTVPVFSDYVGVFCRLSSPSGSYNGYQASWAGSSLTIQRLDAGVQTQLGAAVTLAKANGYKLGIEAIGSTIKVYADTGGGWVERASRTDSTHSAAGYIGFDAFDGSSLTRIDDFGGGTVVGGGGGPVAPRLLGLLGCGT